MRPAAALAAALLLAGCGANQPSGAPDVVVEAGSQRVEVSPSQYCLDGDGQRYTVTPPIIEVSPDTTIRLTVPDAVAEQGWSVQVYDERLEGKLGNVEVDEGANRFEVNSDDVVPPAFYLVVVEDSGGSCQGLSGGWPVGFLRAGGTLSGPTASATPAPSQG
ncbi:DUF2771 domain-containing protein [Geodermatophilus sp. TF02-6]|uniref:DUF2771 family protein n=1 Tax=Geodermatophilus sp. TF02-6 TaxID=2250575 RepID=UPI000DEBD75B|nr:DUF2771 family protein [Geodermatophilus sp. TF02-6]RBY75253.1 DUF2771 domain-containing protein [Geodermatophilus sp. TF02-6]